MAKLDMKKLSKEEVERALALLEKDIERKEKIAKGEIKGGKKWSELTEEEKDVRRKASKRRNAKIAVIVQKALAKGLDATDKEIDEYLASSK